MFRSNKKKSASKGRINTVTLYYDRHLYIIDMQKMNMTFGNYIFPRDRGVNYPANYFDIGGVRLNKGVLNYIKLDIHNLIKKHKFIDKYSLLPNGAFHDAYLCITVDEKSWYYTYTFEFGNDHRVRKEPVAKEFTRIVALLNEYCTFPKMDRESAFELFTPELLRKLEGKPENSLEYTGYHYSETGISRYYFYRERQKICSIISESLNSPTVSISGEGIEWLSFFDSETTIFPGLTRQIDELNGETVGKVSYLDTGKYLINDSIEVYCNKEKYAFYCNEKLIAVISPYDESSKLIPNREILYSEPNFKVFASSEVDDRTLMLILAFPILRFAL